MDGFGVNIQRLFGNYGGDVAARAVGREIASMAIHEESDPNELRIRFADGSGIVLFDSGQSCCEHRYMRTDDDLDDVRGAALEDIEIADGPKVDGEYECHDIEFLRIHTNQGIITIANHNEHNGYYGGFAVVCREWEDEQ